MSKAWGWRGGSTGKSHISALRHAFTGMGSSRSTSGRRSQWWRGWDIKYLSQAEGEEPQSQPRSSSENRRTGKAHGYWPTSSAQRGFHQFGLDCTTRRTKKWGFIPAPWKKFRNSIKIMPKAHPHVFLYRYKHLEPFPSLGSTEKGAQGGHRRKGGLEGAQGDEAMGPRHPQWP